MSLASCENDPMLNFHKYAKVYMPQAKNNPNKRLVAIVDTAQSFSCNAYIGGPSTFDHDIHVNFSVTPSLVDSFNVKNGTSYTMKPKGSYKLGTTDAIIPADKSHTPVLKLNISTEGYIHNGGRYLLPVEINVKNGKIVINKNLRITYFAISVKSKPSGSGTEANPYKVSSFANLKWVSNHPSAWGSTLKQIQDIDASTSKNIDGGKGFAPIGTNGIAFKGNYNGDGHRISGLTTARPDGNYIGLFGELQGTIQNLHLTEVDITGNRYTGGLVGDIHGTVKKSSVTGNVAGGNHTGGLAGDNRNGIVMGSYATVTVSSGNFAGGLVGSNYNGTIKDSYATGNVTGGNHTGGVTGLNRGGAITKTYATGNVSGGPHIGGLVGLNFKGSTVTTSYWDIQASGQPQSDDGTGLETAKMQGAAAKANMQDFDFSTTWKIRPNSYPTLQDSLPLVNK